MNSRDICDLPGLDNAEGIVTTSQLDYRDQAERHDQVEPVFMGVHQIDPTKDTRWSRFIERHSKASVFHSVGWLQALQRTYGYQPTVLTTSSPSEELKNGFVFCRVKSWLTGLRLVSLPFSDHCEPLCDSVADLELLIHALQTNSEPRDWRYLEVRPISGHFGEVIHANSFSPVAKYYLHTLNLRPNADDLFQSFDKDCVQRRIRRGDRAGLVEQSGRSEELLEDFYRLFVATRSRHNLPPMPYTWFQNLNLCMGESLEMRVAYKSEIPVSAVLTLQFKDIVLYKYGCSDARFKRLGATPWLLWKAIAGAKSRSALRFDFGRTDADNNGLLGFKNHWVPEPQELTYWKFPEAASIGSTKGWKLQVAKRAFSCMPKPLLKLTGRLIYRHIG